MLKEHILADLCRVKSDAFYIITDFEATEAELITKRKCLQMILIHCFKETKPYRCVTVGFIELKITTNVSSIFERANLVHNCAKKRVIKYFIKKGCVKMQ